MSYLEVVSSVPEYYEREFAYEHNFQVDPKMQQMATVRLSFWQALSDLGGFHDGIYVLVKAFIAPIAASLFQAELVKGIRVDPYAEDGGRKEEMKSKALDSNATW